MSTDIHDMFADPEWISDCCGVRGYAELQESEPDDAGNETMVGICSRCKDHAGFHRVTDDF